MLRTALNGSSWVVCLKRHPEVLHSGPEGVRFTQEVRLHCIRRLDVLVNRIESAGSIEERSVNGVNRSGTEVQSTNIGGRDDPMWF